MSTSRSPRSKTRSARPAFAVAFALALPLLAAGCLDGLEAPFAAETEQLACSDASDARYVSAAGSVADLGIALSDGDPPAAFPIIHDNEYEPGLAVIGSSQEGDYEFYILNEPVIDEGSAEVVRSSVAEPSGIRLVLELERRSLGSIALDSLAGEITFETVTDDELAGHFDAAFGTLNDQFVGCFHVDIVRSDSNAP